MRIVLPLGRNWTSASASLARRYQAEGFECHGITHYRRWAEAGERLGFRKDRIFYVNAKDPDRSVSLAELERRFGSPTLWPYVLADRHLEGADHEFLAGVMAEEFGKIESFLETVRPDIVVLDAVDRLGYLFLHDAAVQLGIKVLIPTTARIPGRFVIVDNPFDRWTRVENLYEGYKKEGVPEEARRAADSFVAEFRRNRTQPSYVTYSFETPRLGSGLRKGVRYVSDYYRSGGRGEYSSTPPHVHAYRELRRVLASRWTRGFESPVPGERYMFVPLQVHPESSIMVFAPGHLDQPGVVEDLSRAIPFEMKLYVKEHIPSLGTRPKGFYDRIRRLPNVRLISPFVHPHDLIQNAAMVATISSTAGWEAVLYEKPVLTLGNVFYNTFDGVTTSAGLGSLANEIDSALHSGGGGDDALLTFVSAVLEGTYVGEMDPDAPGFLEEDNIERIGDALLSEMRDAAVE